MSVGTEYTYIGAEVQRDYWLGSGYTDVVIPANSVKFVCSDTNTNGSLKAIPHGQTVSGKVLLKPLASGMYAKVAFVIESKISQAISVPTMKISGSAHTTAHYSTDTRSTSISYAKDKAFYLTLYEPNYTSPTVKNINEYQSPTYLVPGTSSTLWGNYGINYNLTLTGAAGKTLRISPDWTSVHSNGYVRQDYAFYNGSTWTILHFSDNEVKDIVVPSNGNIKFTLPGGNTSNVYFKFIN